MATYLKPEDVVSALLGSKSMSDVVPATFQPTLPMPMPPTDPRGSTFVDRLPHGSTPYEFLGSHTPPFLLGNNDLPVPTHVPKGMTFGADTFPTELLMRQRGYATVPDVNSYTPADIMRARMYSIPVKRPDI